MTRGSHDIEIRDIQEDDLPDLWKILQGWPEWWQGKNRPRTLEEFIPWWRESEKPCMVGVDSEAGIIGAVYLDPVHPGQWATPHIVKRKGYGDPRLIRAILRSPGKLQRWFFEYDLSKFWTWTASRSAVTLAILLGFRVEGKVRQYILTDKGWLDAWQLSLLREDAWKQTPTGNIIRLLAWKLTG
jgi:hypothetical protein